MAGYMEYKDSGIPWIGTIPSHWEIQRNKNCFSCEKNIVGLRSSEVQLLSLTTTGIKKKSFDDIGGKVPESYDTYQIVQKNDIVMCLFDLDCSAVFSGLSKYDGMISPAYKVIRCKDTILPGFADYWFRSVFVGRKFKYLAKNIRYSLTYEDFSALTLPLPSLSEQMAIVEYLDAVCADIDQVIAEAKGSIEEYKAWKASIIYEAVTKGLDPNAEMKDSGIKWIGQIPSDWDVMKLKNIVTYIESGVSVNASQSAATEGKIGVLKTSSVSKYCFKPEENKEVNTDELDRVACPVKGNTIIVSRMNTPELVGACGYVEHDIPHLYLPDRLWQVHFSDSVVVKYVWYYLSSNYIRSYYASLSSGTSSSMQNISQGQFGNAYFLFPSKDTQQKIADSLDVRCETIDAIIAEKEKLIADLESYKKSLIFEVVTGKRKVV